MSFPYTVKSGDTLTRIAAQHGFADWREIYRHPDNAAFRAKRPNPDLIFPGDVLMIPREEPPAPPPVPPPPPPPPPPTPAPTRAVIERDLRAYLARDAKRDVVTALGTHAANLIVFGEIHRNNDPAKAGLLAALVRQVAPRPPVITHFHASELFNNDQRTRDEISRFLQADPRQLPALAAQLSADLRPYRPVLTAANRFPGRRYGVLPIQFAGGQREDIRHTALFQSFEVSARVCPDVPFDSINSTTSRGNMLLGLRHAARQHIAGRATKTTCGQLIDAGWTVLAARLTVHEIGDGRVPEHEKVRLIAGTDQTEIDLLAIIEDVSGGTSFFADLTKEGSPFSQVRLVSDNAVAIPYNQLFDAIVHLA